MAHSALKAADMIRLGVGVCIVALDLSVITMFILDWWRGDTSFWQSPDDENDEGN